MADPIFNYVAANPFGLSDVGSRASPIMVDIDGDNDLDAFVGNSDGNTLFYRNTGTANNPAFAAASTNPFGLSDVGYIANPDFVDIDGDGDLDAFIGDYDGKTLFFKNTGTVNSPSFIAAVTNPFGLSDVGYAAHPDFVDIDGDGDLDAFTGEYHGNMLFFKNIGTVNNPSFAAAVSNPFGLSDVGGSAAPSFVDIDGDGDLDAIVSSGHYSGGGGTSFFRNIGTTGNPLFYQNSFNPFGLGNASYSTLTFADIDDDNDLDVFMGAADGDTLFFQNSGAGNIPNFSWKGSFSLQNVGDFPNPTFVDIDGDGDLDAFAGQGYSPYDGGESKGDTLFFENTGTVRNPVFAAAITNPFGLSNSGNFSHPAFVDIDGDSDLDAFIGNDTGNMLFQRNTGTVGNPIFAATVTNPFGLSDVGTYAVPTFVDIDSDGDSDVFVNDVFFKNTGSVSNPVFAAPQSNPFGLGSSSSGFVFRDVDGDGDLDALGFFGLYRNTGTANTPVFSKESSPFDLPDAGYRSYFTSKTYVDIDGDGDLDAYVTSAFDYNTFSTSEYFLINDNAPNVANLTVPETYTRNTPLNLTDIVISDPDSVDVTATLTVSNSAAGSLSTGTSGAVTSTFNAGTGTWTASGALADVNTLLADLIFTPAFNFKGAFTIKTSISDGAAAPLIGNKNFSVLLVSTPGDDMLTGTTFDSDTLTYAFATGPVTVSLNINTQQNTIGAGLDTITKVENLIGSPFADNLTGNSANNILEGKGGNDTLMGWSGADTMIGGPGNDSYFVENPKDVVLEKLGEGTDTVSSRLSYTVPENVENLVLTGTAVVSGTGNNLDNVITGNNAANQLNGQAGNDTLIGGGGDDTLTGWSGADIMIGGLGNDRYFVENTGDVVTENFNQGTDTVSSRLTYTLLANVENLILTGAAAVNGTGNGLDNSITGNAAVNNLIGGAGNDTLNGGAGNDILIGGTGKDTLTGGTGSDMFRFIAKDNIDKIVDYIVVDDTIQLEDSIFTALTTIGTLAANNFIIGTSAVDSNDFIVYNTATGALLYDADGNGAVAAVQIATLAGGLALTNTDFVVI